ncbi:hypothetical protein KKF84_15120 [Myxococcota bacterium]|nr:hypothetical protein [Myxococcota bacterium]MBU1536656.1 hypothetical protein [Myxococcota bacterium]
MISVSYSAVGGPGHSRDALFKALQKWLSSEGYVTAKRGKSDVELMNGEVTSGGSWLYFLKPGRNKASAVLSAIATSLAQSTAKPVILHLVGCIEEGGTQTTLAYESTVYEKGAKPKELISKTADTYLDEVNPVSDDHPTENYMELLDLLVGKAESDDFVDESGLSFDGSWMKGNGLKSLGDVRLDAIREAILDGAKVDEVEFRGKKGLQLLRIDGIKQVTFLKENEWTLLAPYIPKKK